MEKLKKFLVQELIMERLIDIAKRYALEFTSINLKTLATRLMGEDPTLTIDDAEKLAYRALNELQDEGKGILHSRVTYGGAPVFEPRE
jgi:hypothetical protein